MNQYERSSYAVHGILASISQGTYNENKLGILPKAPFAKELSA